MTFAAALRQHLLADAAIAARVGDRVYPVFVPVTDEGQVLQGDSICYTLTGAPASEIVSAPRDVRRQWQLTAISTDYDHALELAELIIIALDRYKGPMGGFTVARCKRDTMGDMSDFDSGRFGVVQTYDVIYQINP